MAKKQIIAGLVLATIAVFSVPLAANADSYVPGGGCSVSPSTVRQGGTAVFTCTAGTFADSENVAFVVSGTDGSNASLASFRTSTSSIGITKLSGSDGSATLNITVPGDASGPYAITGTGKTSNASSTATITVVPASTTVSTTGSSGFANGRGLADTGSVVSTSLLWIGSGIVVLGAIVLLALALTRRRRHQNP